MESDRRMWAIGVARSLMTDADAHLPNSAGRLAASASLLLDYIDGAVDRDGQRAEAPLRNAPAIGVVIN